MSILSVMMMSNRMGLEDICLEAEEAAIFSASSASNESIYSINLARLATVRVFGD